MNQQEWKQLIFGKLEKMEPEEDASRLILLGHQVGFGYVVASRTWHFNKSHCEEMPEEGQPRMPSEKTDFHLRMICVRTDCEDCVNLSKEAQVEWIAEKIAGAWREVLRQEGRGKVFGLAFDRVDWDVLGFCDMRARHIVTEDEEIIKKLESMKWKNEDQKIKE